MTNNEICQIYQISGGERRFGRFHLSLRIANYIQLRRITNPAQRGVRTAKGRIDMVLQTATDLYVMELKIDRPTREALAQIDTNGYLLPFGGDLKSPLYGLRLHKVGISFSTTERTLSGWEIADI